MTAGQFISALQAGINAIATAAATTPSTAATGKAQVNSADNPIPAPTSQSQAAAAKKASASTPSKASATVKTDWISKYLGWLVPKGWTPAKL